MKKIIICLTAVAVMVGSISCNKNKIEEHEILVGGCDTKRPAYNSIDWNNYNDVFTVYWNFYGSEDIWNGTWESRPSSPTPLMVCGYIRDYSLEKKYLVLIDDSLAAVQNQIKRERIVARWYSDSVSDIINNSNIHNKFFISAYQLVMRHAPSDCAYYEIELLINYRYIYFKND